MGMQVKGSRSIFFIEFTDFSNANKLQHTTAIWHHGSDTCGKRRFHQHEVRLKGRA